MTVVPVWEPGYLTARFAAIEGSASLRARSGLAELARAIESGAKAELSKTTHPYGKPTAASPGSPPSLVSGTLRRSVTHSAVAMVGPGEWETKVGTGAGFYPPVHHTFRARRAAAHANTPSSQYGKYLETGLRNGATYPWLKPVFDAALFSLPTIMRTEFRTLGERL